LPVLVQSSTAACTAPAICGGRLCFMLPLCRLGWSGGKLQQMKIPAFVCNPWVLRKITRSSSPGFLFSTTCWDLMAKIENELRFRVCPDAVMTDRHCLFPFAFSSPRVTFLFLETGRRSSLSWVLQDAIKPPRTAGKCKSALIASLLCTIRRGLSGDNPCKSLVFSEKFPDIRVNENACATNGEPGHQTMQIRNRIR
jgi:hypothetical protein